VRENRTLFYILVFVTFLITAISFRSYFKYASYNLDDYTSFDMSPGGISVLESCRATTDSLYRVQKRYQPVRLCLFVALTRFVEEENSVYYNFALHLLNILLLFLLLRKFGVGEVFSFVSVLVFAVYGRFRYMDSSSVMIGGSGLNLFLILLTFLFLIKALETRGPGRQRRFAFLGVSVLAYTSLVFSYEVAAPLFAPLVLIFYLFNHGKRSLAAQLVSKRTGYLLLYFIPLAVYIIFFRLLVKVGYEGAEVQWGAEIFTRLKAYIDYTLFPPVQTHGLVTIEFVILALYFGVLALALKAGRRVDERNKKNGLRLLLFGLVFYPSTVVLFALNHWMKPTSVMVHHTYLMTAASAVLVSAFFYNLQWLLPASWRRKYLSVLAVLLFPIVLINAERHTVLHYKNDAVRVGQIRAMKKELQTAISDIENVDAIILKNFYEPYLQTGSMNGAFKKWFGFRKDIMSGREIVSVKGDEIVFKGPLFRYSKPTEQKVQNGRVRIFFVNLETGAPAPYYEVIDFTRSLNLDQTMHMMSDWKLDGERDPRVLEAILSNERRNRYFEIWFLSKDGAEKFLENLKNFELNGEQVPAQKFVARGDHLVLDISDTTDMMNYYFITIRSSDKRFRQGIRFIGLSKKEY
jgi:hypothetical protein